MQPINTGPNILPTTIFYVEYTVNNDNTADAVYPNSACFIGSPSRSQYLPLKRFSKYLSFDVWLTHTSTIRIWYDFVFRAPNLVLWQYKRVNKKSLQSVYMYVYTLCTVKVTNAKGSIRKIFAEPYYGHE